MCIPSSSRRRRNFKRLAQRYLSSKFSSKKRKRTRYAKSNPAGKCRGTHRSQSPRYLPSSLLSFFLTPFESLENGPEMQRPESREETALPSPPASAENSLATSAASEDF